MGVVHYEVLMLGNPVEEAFIIGSIKNKHDYYSESYLELSLGLGDTVRLGNLQVNGARNEGRGTVLVEVAAIWAIS